MDESLSMSCRLVTSGAMSEDSHSCMFTRDTGINAPRIGADAVEVLRSAGDSDDLDATPVAVETSRPISARNGKAGQERRLADEFTDHLMYENGDPVGRELPSARNGLTPRRWPVRSVPLDWLSRAIARAVSPRRWIPGAHGAWSASTTGSSRYYAGGMTVRDIRHHLAATIDPSIVLQCL